MEIDHEITSTSLLIQEKQLSVTGRSMCTSTGYPLEGISLSRNSVNRLTDHTPHDPNGLTGL